MLPAILQPQQIPTPAPTMAAAVLQVPIRRASFALAVTLTVAQAGNTTLATATSSLTGTVYFFWYLDGLYVGSDTGISGSAVRTFVLGRGEQANLDVLASNDPNFDFLANAPTAYPARRMLVFTRSLDPGIVKYRIEQKQVGLIFWGTLGFIADDPRRWLYEFVTPRLVDLTNQQFRVTPIDSAGDDGTPIVYAAELIVRTPDSPNFTATFQAASTQVLFAPN